MKSEPEKKQSLAREAHRLLEEKFVTLELVPGSRWSEEALMNLLDIGRTPVREALQRLNNDHLIDVVPRQGIVISEIDVHVQMQALEVRRGLEMLTCSLATLRASKADRARLIEVAEQMEAVSGHEVRNYLTTLFDVNRMIAQLSGNQFAQRAISPLHTLSRRFYFRYHRQLDNLEIVGYLHARRARAVAAGFEKAALDATNDLMAMVEDYTRRIMMGEIVD